MEYAPLSFSVGSMTYESSNLLNSVINNLICIVLQPHSIKISTK